MIFIPLFVFIAIFIFASRQHRLTLRAIDLVANTVTTATEALLVNDLPKINTPSPNSSPPCRVISETIKKYLYLGKLQADSLRFLQQTVAVARRHQEQVWQIRLLFMTRSGAVLVFTMLGNFFLANFIAFSPPSSMLIAAISGVIIAGFILLEKTVPVSWFWQKGMTEMGHKWITALLDRSDYTFHTGLREIQQREIIQGIDLSREKMSFLTDWHARRELEAKTNLKKYQDFFPLLEMLLFSLLVALQLFPIFSSLITILER